MQKRYILVDAGIAAAAFAPKTTRSQKLVSRSATLLLGKSSMFDAQLLIPNFCIGETFAVFEKYRWGAKWNKHVNPAMKLTPSEFRSARKYFHDAIHNGTRLLQVALDRYHILCLDLVAPINAAYRIKRDRGKKKYVSPAGTYDLTLLAMGIWLQKQFGEATFMIVTGDERLALVSKRAKSVALSQAMKAHLSHVASTMSMAYGPDIYPQVLDIARCSRADLHAALPDSTPAW